MHLSTISLALTRIGMGGPLQGAAMLQDFTSGNQTLDPRITFTRGSNATVTDSTGKIAHAPHNLLTYSEQFDNAAWSKSNSTVTANAVVAPDGTTTADSIIVTTGGSTDTGVRITTTQAASTVYTTSVYAKYLNTRYLVIRNLAVGATLGAQWVFFDLINGRVGVTGTGITASITSVGNGWYRCSATATTLSTITNNLVDYRLSDVDGSYTVTTGSNIYIWGAQLNVGALQPYYPTAVKNLLGYTQEFDNVAWTKSNSFIQTNQIRNNTMQGAVAGTPGTLPTNWSTYTALTGLTRQIVGTGMEDGINYIDIRISGTPSGAGSVSYFTETSTAVAALSGQTWTVSTYLKLQAGSLSGVTSTRLYFQENNSSGSYLTEQNITVTAPTSASLTSQRSSATRTLSNASTAYVMPGFNLLLSGAAIDITLRIGMPQLVQGATAGDVVATYGTAKAVMYQAPDGTLSADKLVEDAANTAHFIGSSATVTLGTTYSFSCYAKEAQSSPKRYLSLLLPSSQFGSNKRATFDLSAGTVVPTNSPLTASMTSVGSGWWRCEISAIATTGGTTNPYIRIFNATPDTLGSYQGDGTSGIYVWGAQLSDSASLDPYVYNPGAAPSAGPYYGPRFDYDPVTLQPKGLLIEEQRTNLLTYSEQFDNAVWGKISASISSNTATAPDGTTTADKLVENTSNAQHYIAQAFTVTSGTSYTYSVYVKASGRSRVLLLAATGFTANQAIYNLSSVSTSGISNCTASIQSVGNGWYRCIWTATATSSSSSTFHVFLDNGTTTVYTGDGTSGLYIWGAQLEAGSFATSYIPTTSAQVTRAADVATMTGANFSNWYNQSEGTMVVDGDSYVAGSSSYPNLAAFGTDYGNLIQLGYMVPGSGGVIVKNDGVMQVEAYPRATGVNRKAAIAYKVNDFGFTYNGASPTTDTSGSVPAATMLAIGGYITVVSSGVLNGHIRRLAYWNRRLSNAELQGVTA